MTDIAAGIVLYNPDFELLKINIESIISQVEKLVIIDNASDNIKEIEEYLHLLSNCYLTKNSENFGIAKALNQIIKNFEQEFEWVLLLDQDSVVPPNFIHQFKKYIHMDKIGIICPKINYQNDDRMTIQECEEYKFVEKCITSGSLINTEVWRFVDFFDEAMFIDFVDFEYCIRIQKAGYKILQINNIFLRHNLGNLESKRFANRKVRVTNHSAIRYYYYVRNALYTVRKHKNYLNPFPIYRKILKKMAKIILYERDKIGKLHAMFRGYIDRKKI